MCGIAGFYGLKGDEKSNIVRMLDKLEHRGPDGQGWWIDDKCTGLTLGHRRLSIIDLSEAGSQPMASHSGRFVMAYNGEIYNHRYVLEMLRKDGYSDTMRGTSDTEILLEAMEFYGPEAAIGMCKGMFAIALYDRQEQILTLIRDRIGEKPLYYGASDGALIFASELPAIEEVTDISDKLNYDCIGDYLKYGYISAPHTIYKDIYKLEPGCMLKLHLNIKSGINISTNFDSREIAQNASKIEDFSPEYIRYWSIEKTAVYGQSHLFAGNRTEAADELERLLKSSIKDQMVADVPLGAFLSAGIDSSTVVALMQSQSDIPVRTFTIGFEDGKYNEATDAAEIAKHLGTEHTELYVTKQDALDVIPKLPVMFGEPFADSSQIPTYLVSRMTRQHVTVSLSGDGGDELFAGYRDYRGVNNIYNKIKKLPLWMRKSAGSLMEAMPESGRLSSVYAHGVLLKAKDPADLYRRTYETIGLADRLLGQAALEGRDRSLVGKNCKYDDFDPALCGEDAVHTAMLMNMEMYHPDDILVKVDRTAMAVSLETRVPMLDRDLVEFAWTLPSEYLYNDKEGKLILKDVLYRYVPREMMDRPKKGFGVPISNWLAEAGLKDWAGELLNQESINKDNLLDAKATGEMWSDYINKGIWRPQIWYALMLQSWLRDRKR